MILKRLFLISRANSSRLANLSLAGQVRLSALLTLAFCFLLSTLSAPGAAAATYYLAPAANGGSDANNGLSSSTPWLSPNHSLNCGDVILAVASTAYDPSNFDSGNWGRVSCPASNNVAWLQCQTFDACKLYSRQQGFYIDQSYWGVQGWEVTVAPGAPGFCFGAAPNYTHPAEVHHVIFANNVANGCQAGGFSSFNIGSSAGVDYLAIIGNIVYDAIQGGENCYTGISVYQPVQSDSIPGTHIYVGGNFAWHNFQPNPCGGVQAWGGDGIIFDTLDGSQGVSRPYIAQAVADNNIVVANGGHGIEVQNNVAGPQHAPIYIRHNTSWGNELDTSQQENHLCAEILLNSAFNVQELGNLVGTYSATACAGNPIYALSAFTVNSTVSASDNFVFGYNGQNTFVYNGQSFQYASSNTVGVNPDFKNAAAPGSPACRGTGSVPGCVAGVIFNFTPTNNRATAAGYKPPTNAQGYDSLFPQWVCNISLPPGLITKGC